ncbi:unnamed protein product [Rotaria sordida]|uniref:Uncharacterized protein n=1 Tax=Rotaria sordida TaxID=392033 RepID=A0A818MFJ6_9BILA|nr:unnamed protein product [Rotaria sordida]
MNIASFRDPYGYDRKRQTSARQHINYGGNKYKRGLFHRLRSVPVKQTVTQAQYSPQQYPYGSRRLPQLKRPYLKPSPAFPITFPKPYNNYGGHAYNNFSAYPYMPPNQPMMMPSVQPIPSMIIPPPRQFQPIIPPPRQVQPIIPPPRPVQPIVPPQQVPQFQPIILPQQVPEIPPMMMPQQIIPPMSPPYLSPPYSMAMPASSTPYVQQQLQAQPIINNMGVSPPISAGITNPVVPNVLSNQGRPINFFTDWTGGGKISPGFLGPPI